MNSIIILLRSFYDELNNKVKPAKIVLLQEYIEDRDKLNDQYEKENLSDKISQKQKPNFIPVEEVNEMLKKMAKNLKGYKHRKLSKEDKMLLQAYVVFKIHMVIPLRNDLVGMEVITKSQFNKLTTEDKKEKNYLIQEKTKMSIVKNKYKTSKTYEEAITIIEDKKLKSLLRSFIKIRGMDDKDNKLLLKTSSGAPLTRNALTQTLIKFSKEYTDGKSLGTTILAKIVFSKDKQAEKNEKQKKLAAARGTSVETINKIYVKKKD